jgi:hypothetical protein
VVSVGGTSLTLTSGGNYGSETGWRSGGGGTSQYVPKPAYQAYVSTPSSTKRTSPDVAYNADPNTGVLVYDSVNGGWFAYGGTSAGAPQWAALVAIADQGRAQLTAPQPSLDGAGQTLYALYEAAKADYASAAVSEYHDITSGRNGPGSAAKAGYDTVTGVGTPLANQVVTALVAWTGSGTGGSFTGGSTSQTPPPAGWGSFHAIAGAAVSAAQPAAPSAGRAATTQSATPPVVSAPAGVQIAVIPVAPVTPAAPGTTPVAVAPRVTPFFAPAGTGDAQPVPASATAGTVPPPASAANPNVGPATGAATGDQRQPGVWYVPAAGDTGDWGGLWAPETLPGDPTPMGPNARPDAPVETDPDGDGEGE